MPRLEEYAHKYPDIRFERRNGILQMTLHTGRRAAEVEPAHPSRLATKSEVTPSL